MTNPWSISNSSPASEPGLEPPSDERQRLLQWAVGRWNAEVKNRPLVNIHRRSLDDTWRQVIRFAGGDPGALVGPSHDALLAESAPTPPAEAQAEPVDALASVPVVGYLNGLHDGTTCLHPTPTKHFGGTVLWESALVRLSDVRRALSTPAQPAQAQGEAVLWQCRTFLDESAGWSPWEEVRPRNLHAETVDDRLRQIRELIAIGHRHELRALYATPPAPPAVEPKRWAQCPETDRPCSACPTARIQCQAAQPVPAQAVQVEPSGVAPFAWHGNGGFISHRTRASNPAMAPHYPDALYLAAPQPQAAQDVRSQMLSDLRWYADEANAIARHLNAQDMPAVLASMNVLAMDAGRRAEKYAAIDAELRAGGAKDAT